MADTVFLPESSSPEDISVPERDSRRAGSLNYVMHGVHPLGLAQHFGQGQRDDVRRLQGEHRPPLLVLHCLDRGAAESRGEEPVVAGWLSAALQVAERERATLLAGLPLDDLRELLAHTAEPLRFAGERRA